MYASGVRIYMRNIQMNRKRTPAALKPVRITLHEAADGTGADICVKWLTAAIIGPSMPVTQLVCV